MLHSDLLKEVLFLFVYVVSFQSLGDMAPKYILEQFLEAELLINITEHEVSIKACCVGIIYL